MCREYTYKDKVSIIPIPIKIHFHMNLIYFHMNFVSDRSMDDFRTILVPCYRGGTTDTKMILNFGSNAVIIHDVVKNEDQKPILTP